MKGDKIHKNRGENLFDKIVYNVDFQDSIKNIRKQLKIPTKGFSNTKNVYAWYSKNQPFDEIKQEILKSLSSLLTKQKLPNNEWWQQKLLEYVFNNCKFSFLPRTYPINSFIEVINKNTDFAKGTFVDLRIYEGISQRDVIDFIKQHWLYVKPAYRHGTAKIIQPERDQKINKRILEMFSDPREKLGSKDIPKEILIQRKLKKEFGKSPEFEAIKMRAHRKRHQKR